MMISRFFSLVQGSANITVEVGYNSVSDWCIGIIDKTGCSIGEAGVVFRCQDCSYDLVFAKAYCALCEYLRERDGGY